MAVLEVFIHYCDLDLFCDLSQDKIISTIWPRTDSDLECDVCNNKIVVTNGLTGSFYKTFTTTFPYDKIDVTISPNTYRDLV